MTDAAAKLADVASPAPAPAIRRIAKDINVRPFLAELARRPELWSVNRSRQELAREQRHTETINLRGASDGPAPVMDRQGCQDTVLAPAFPLLMGFLRASAERLGGSLARAMIVRLAPGRDVQRHSDFGLYYRFRDRFHLVLSSSRGSPFSVGETEIRMREGELWWFDNKQEHAARNDGADWRVHVIFDLLPPALAPGVALVDAAQARFARPLEAVVAEPRLARLHQAIRDRCVFFDSPEQPLVHSNGASSRWLIDLRIAFMDGALVGLIAALFWERFADRLPFQVGGLEAGAIPLVTAILIEGERRGTPINGFWVRKERKEHGRTKRIEGVLTGDPVVIVDDLLNGGGTAENVRVAVMDEGAALGARIGALFVVVDYGARDGRVWMARHAIPLEALFALGHFGLDRGDDVAPSYPPRFDATWDWRPPKPGSHFHVVPKSTPALDGERLYFGTDSGAFVALDQATGQAVWSFQTADVTGKGILSSPALHQGRVYFGAYDGNLYCLDAATGSEIWRFSAADWIGSSPALDPAQDRLFVGLEHARAVRQGGLAALRLSTGELIWERAVAEYLHGSPLHIPALGAVAVGTNDDCVILVEAATGRLIWRFDCGGAVKGGLARAPDSGDLVFGHYGGRIHVVDVATGIERWSVETGDVVHTTPLLLAGRAYLGSADKHLYRLDLGERRVMRKLYPKGRIYASPVLVDGRIYVGTTAGRLLEIDPMTLEVNGSAQFPEKITGPVTYSAARRLFYVQTNDNRLFAVRRHAEA